MALILLACIATPTAMAWSDWPTPSVQDLTGDDRQPLGRCVRISWDSPPSVEIVRC